MAQNLTTNIVINAKAGNGFNEVGSVLAEMGSIVNGISQELINFGKDSVDVYKNYEKSMTEAEIALSTVYGRGTKELNNVMNDLDQAAAQWAATTIFHTDDVGEAIANAAHAGWDYDQIMSGIPAAMQLAQAGSLDLSDAVDYITKATHAAGIEFDDLGDFVDHWTYAANRSATDIEGMGDAMLKMGATMKFTGSSDDLLVMLAELANAGTVGSDAGTLLRNSMLRLVSPTKKARDVMEGLGAESEEIEEILNDEALAAANAQLATMGFSAYDDQGNLKNMLDIFTDLSAALDGMSEQERNDVLGSIFPTRSITGAMALLEAAKENWHGLYEELSGGDAAGYGKYAQGSMMETLYGQIEIFDSKVEELKRKTGSVLAGDVSAVLESMGGWVDSLSQMDAGAFNSIVAGLEVVGVAGPGIIAASTAMRFLGTVLSPGGAVALGVTVLAGLVAALEEFSEFQLRDQFGTQSLDNGALSAYVDSLTAEFDAAYGQVQAYNDIVNQAVNSYKTASSTLSGDLFTAMLTKKELTPDDISALQGLGDTMAQSVIDGIQASYDQSADFLALIFGSSEGAAYEENPEFQSLLGMLTASSEGSIAEAEAIGQNLRNALTAAFSDGKITDEEYNNILSTMRDLNEKMAEAERQVADEKEYAKHLQMLDKAQSASYDEMSAMTQEIYEESEQRKEDIWTDAYDTLARLTKTDVDAIAELQEAYEQASDPQSRAAIVKDIAARQARVDAATQSVYDATEKLLLGASEKTDEFLMQLWMSNLAGDRELGGTYESIMDVARQYLYGGLPEEAAIAALNTNKSGFEQLFAGMFGEGSLASTLFPFMGNIAQTGLDTTAVGQIGNVFTEMINAMGGFEELGAKIADYNAQGMYDMAASLSELYTAAMLMNGFQGEGMVYNEGIAKAISGDTTYYNTGDQREEYEVAVKPVVEQADLYESVADMTLEVPVEPYVASVTPMSTAEAGDAFDVYSAMDDQFTTTVNVDADTAMMQEKITNEDGQTLTEFVDGETGELHVRIWDEDGQTLTEYITGNPAQLEAIIQQYQGRTIRLNIATTGDKYAEGGRAVTASIFGEAGPEWAIPEAHTQRTAELLNAAREASGFTWPELLSQFGGLNSGSSGVGSIVYSPVINANDASGIDQVLRDDKERLRRMLREERMLNAMEVYA